MMTSMTGNNDRLIQTIYGSFMIDGVRDKKMATGLESDIYPNEGLFAVARLFVNEKSVVVDIGAHIGTFAIPIARSVEKVIAFEPSADAFPLLVQNAKENKVEVNAINKALGGQAGSGKIVVRNASNAGANTLVSGGGDVTVSTLDTEVTHADFIKIDVEGMELEVLRGGTKLIEHSRPVVLFEVNLSQLRSHGTSPRALESFFIKHGYRLYVPSEGGNGTLARVMSATLLTALIAPRAWLTGSDSAPFDLVAVPKERTIAFQSASFATALARAFSNNISVKVRRLRALIR